MKNKTTTILTLSALVVVTLLALIVVEGKLPAFARSFIAPADAKTGLVSLDTQLIQGKVLHGVGGEVAVMVTMKGAEIAREEMTTQPPVDLLVVLDRSGSMGGQKIHDAREAVVRLMERLSPQDRLGIVTYANGVQTIAPLTLMTNRNRAQLAARVRSIMPGGGTNLGGGLQQGISSLQHNWAGERVRRIILISDGLANKGVTDPHQLGRIAARATEFNLGISTVGVGYDFNELLMTTIADHGAGNYYFLEDPVAFATVFEKEFNATKNVAGSGVEITVPLPDGVQLIEAGGYPIRHEAGRAIVAVGDLLSGQTRRLYFTYRVPGTTREEFDLGRIQLSYYHQNTRHLTTAKNQLTVFTADSEQEVISSIDKESWSKLVTTDAYNQLKESVATSIRKGKKQEALQTINQYQQEKSSLNSQIGSASVADNLAADVEELRQSVEETFAGAPAEVEAKRKQEAKNLQYESYRLRRDK